MLKIKPVGQRAGFCGPASLKMVLAFFGVKKSEKELGRLTGCTTRHGTTAQKIVRAARQLGFVAKTKDDSTIADLRRLVVGKRMPVIVDWFSADAGHYSVVVHIDKRFAYLNDPELARVRKIDVNTFERVWFDFESDYLRTPKDLILRRMIVICPKIFTRAEKNF